MSSGERTVCEQWLFVFLQHQKGSHNAKKSDIPSDVIARSPNSASLSNDCLVGVTSSDTYGFVHRNGTNIFPQRSLESPGQSRMCDILLDLERSSRSCSDEMSPGLMAKSYHGHYHNLPWHDIKMRMPRVSGALAETDWRHDAMLAAQVITFIHKSFLFWHCICVLHCLLE